MTVLEDEDYRAQLHEGLAEAAEICRPRLFAIHGLTHTPGHGPILGWGVEFPDALGAIFTDPDSGMVHVSTSAEAALRTLSIIGEVHLTWLDPE